MISILTRMNFFIKYSLIENKKRCAHYFLCIFSCFLVGLVCLISKTILNEGPIIFLMITEQRTGENDLIIKPYPNRLAERNNINDYQFFNSHINYSKFNEMFRDCNYQSSPRIQNRGSAWIFSNNRTSQDNKNNKTNKNTNKKKAGETVSIDLFILDLKREKEIELGSSFPNIYLGKNECLIHQNLARLLNINKTNVTDLPQIEIAINMQPFLTNLLISKYYMNETHEYNPNITKISYLNYFNIKFPCKIKGILDENFGKLDQEIHSTVIMDYVDFHEHISDYLSKELIEYFPDLPQLLKSNKNNKNPNKNLSTELNKNTFSSYDYADYVIVNFPKPRINSYTVANFDDLQLQGVKYANKIVERFGALSSNFNVDLPIIKNIKPLFNGAIFLSIILNIIIICLFGLSVLLIFSLLQISIETRIYEFGILRIIGSTKSNLIILILTQCLTFSIPSFALAYFVHIYILDLIQNLLSSVTETNLQLKQEFGSIFYALIMTNLVPLVAAFYPIKSVFKNSLAYSLNTNVSKTSGVKIEIFSTMQNEKKSMIIFGFLVFLYGISIYYFLPLSMLSMNWGLLLFVLLWILLGMLTGLIILSINFEYLIQKAIVNIFFFWAQTANKIIILKNLTAHRIRNRKTTLMYSLSVGFFILVDVGLKIELKTQELMSLQKTGSYFQISNLNSAIMKPYQIFPSIYTMKKLNLIEDVTFLTPAFESICANSRTALSNLGKMDSYSIDLIGIPANYFDATIPDFLKIDQEDNLDLSFSEKLFLPENQAGMGISGIFTWEADINMKDNFFLNVEKEKKKISLIFEPAFVLHSAPGVKMSAEPIAMIKRSVLVPIHIYVDLLNKCSNFLFNKNYKNYRNSQNTVKIFKNYYFNDLAKFSINENKAHISFNDFPINKVLFKLNFNKDNTELFDKLGDIINYDPSYYVNTWSFLDFKKKLNKISNITSIIFNSVNLIILVFCFFNLSASMTINIKEQQKEIAILRSIGLTKAQLSFVYQAEAFVLLFTSCIIGIVVGTLISFTMTLQQVMFTNLPITFVFSYTKLVYLFVVSIISGILSTIIPTKIMLSQSISNMLKNS